jgi:hypothetical protein
MLLSNELNATVKGQQETPKTQGFTVHADGFAHDFFSKPRYALQIGGWIAPNCGHDRVMIFFRSAKDPS